MKYKEGDEVYVVIVGKWTRGVYRCKIEEVRDLNKYTVIMDMGEAITIKNVYTRREIVKGKELFKGKEDAEKYYESVLRAEIDSYKREIKDITDLVEFCLKYNVSGDSRGMDAARLAVIERKCELGIECK